MKTVANYFNTKADQYDDTDKQAYWRFSDELLFFLLKELFLPKNTESQFSLLDAGGGTGRWTHRILREYRLSNSFVIDISSGMLKVAKQKFASNGYQDRTQVCIDDLCSLSKVEKQKFDFAICFHNVIGFVNKPLQALKNIQATLKKKGKFALMVPSLYHALYFSNANNRFDELNRILTERKVCYNDEMPPLRVFELKEMEQLLYQAGFGSLKAYGFPVTFYPGMNETFLEGQTERIVDLLDDSNAILFDVEKKLCLDPVLAPRGNNLLFLTEKQVNH